MRPVPALVLVAALVAALVASCGGGEEEPGASTARSAVLITLDTTTPRSVDLYGKDRGVTPRLTELAAESVVYDRAWTVAPLTLPAHASMLTGLFPLRHGVRDNGHLPLPRAARSVAEIASESGALTGAVVAAVVLAAPYGLAEGFDHFEEPAVGGGKGMYMSERPAQSVTNLAIGLVDRRPAGRPMFLWAHYFDPHAPYEPTQADERAAGGAYLGEVHAMDREVGRLLDRLRGEPDFDEMLIVVVADHGEAHGRHGEATHSALIYDAVMRVPMLVRFPRSVRAGERSQETVSVVDVAPTLLGGMGLEPFPGDGKDLARPVPADRGVYMESYCGYLNYGWSPVVAWVQGDTKYIHGTSPELYDLAGDEKEASNLFAPDDVRVTRARAALGRLADARALERTEEDVVDAEDRVDVSQLGYAGMAAESALIPGPLEDTGLPAPRERMGELDAFYQAVLVRNAGRLSQAIDQLSDLVETNPGNNLALSTLGTFLVDAQRYQEALAPLETLLRRGQERVIVLVTLAKAHSGLGEKDKARDLLRRALELVPGDVNAQAELSKLGAE